MQFSDEQKQMFKRAAAGIGCCASQIKHAVCRATEAFAISFERLADIGRRMNEHVAQIRIDAEQVWLKNHSRLPGSTRTKRLRKKRETMLMKNMFQCGVDLLYK